MVNEKTVELITRLHKNTLAGKIPWQRSANKAAFEAAFPRYSLQISEESKRDQLDYVVTILNDEGLEIDEFSDVDLSGRFPQKAPPGGWFTLMDEIYDAARRQALGADQAIETILSELD